MGKRKKIKERKERIRRSKKEYHGEPVDVVKKIQLRMVISGGQTGADQGALWGANNSGLYTGGTCPQGWKTEEGAQKDLLKRVYNLIESESENYPERTKQNVKDSDGTLLIGVPDTKGSKLTIRTCEKLNRPLLHIPYQWSHKFANPHPTDFAERVVKWLHRYNIKTLNVAGNRESINYGITGFTHGLIMAVVGEMRYPGFYLKTAKANLKKDLNGKREEFRKHAFKDMMRNEPRRRLEIQDLEPRRRLRKEDR